MGTQLYIPADTLMIVSPCKLSEPQKKVAPNDCRSSRRRYRMPGTCPKRSAFLQARIV